MTHFGNPGLHLDGEGDSLGGGWPAASLEEWRALAEAALDGRPVESLRKDSVHGVPIEPLYTREGVQRVAHRGGLPGQWPFVRGGAAEGHVRRSWMLRSDLALPSPARFGEAAGVEVAQGATALGLLLDEASRSGLDPDAEEASGLVGRGGLSLATLADLEQALSDLDLATVPVFIEGGTATVGAAALLFALAEKRGLPLSGLRGSLALDPLGELAAGGALPIPISKLYDEMAFLMTFCQTRAPLFRVAVVDLRPYHEAWAGPAQELAIGLATAVEYLRAMTSRGIPAAEAADRLSLSVCLSPQLLVEIAKLRAARLLFALVCDAFGCPDHGALRIHARTSPLWMSGRDPTMNILRAALGTFAAVCGGADGISVVPFDEPLHPAGRFSLRLARHTQLLADLEAHLGQVMDPAGGAFAVEQLTDELAKRAWTLFQEIEAAGGLFEALHRGLVQGWLHEQGKAQAAAVARGRVTLVGVNRYADPDEERPSPEEHDLSPLRRERAAEVCAQRKARMDEGVRQQLCALGGATARGAEAVIEAAMRAAQAGATMAEILAGLRLGADPGPEGVPLLRQRAAQDFEVLRDAADAHVEQSGRRPLALLLELGPSSEHRARMEFAAGFLKAGGFSVEEVDHAGGVEVQAARVRERRVRVAVLVGTDQRVAAQAADAATRLKVLCPGLTLVLAGRPDKETGQAPAGVDHCIYLGADMVSSLRTLQRAAGVEL